MLGKLLGLVILVLNIVATMDCWKSSKDQGNKILWTLIIFLIPGVGLILYYAVGKKS